MGADSGEERPRHNLSPEFLSFLHDADIELEDKYREELERSEAKAEKPPILSLTEIPEEEKLDRVYGLRAKLGEYDARSKKIWDTEKYRAPEVIFTQSYNRDVLRMLLEKGEINTWAMSRALEKRNYTFDPRAYNNAVAVIADYVKTGGKNTSKGGLPTPPKK